MSDLETKARPLLSPILRGNGRELHRGGQGVLAAWAFKTAVMLEYTHPRARTISKAERDWLFSRREAPLGCQIWIGNYSGTLLNTWYKHDQLETDSGDGVFFAITFLMGKVVFQLWGHRERGRVLETKGPLRRRLQQLHPYKDAILVRSQFGLDDRLLREAAQSLAKPGKRDLRGWRFRLHKVPK
jgi:hypothetical protein